MKELVKVLMLAWESSKCWHTAGVVYNYCPECITRAHTIKNKHSVGLLKARELGYIRWRPAIGWALTDAGRDFYKQLLGDFGGPR